MTSNSRAVSELEFLEGLRDGLESILYDEGDIELKASGLLTHVRFRIQQINREEESE